MGSLVLFISLIIVTACLAPFLEDSGLKKARKNGEPYYWDSHYQMRSTESGKLVIGCTDPVYGYCLKEIGNRGPGRMIWYHAQGLAEKLNKEIEGQNKAFHYEPFYRNVLPVENETGRAYEPHGLSSFDGPKCFWIRYYKDPYKLDDGGFEHSGDLKYLDKETFLDKYQAFPVIER